MTDLLLNILIILYGSVGVITAIGFLPTIRDLILKKRSSNNGSYFIWTFCSGVAFLYSLFILPNLLFRIVSGVNFTCCALVLILGIRLTLIKRK